MNKIIEKLIFCLLDSFTERYEEKTYIGHGDFELRRAYRFKSGNLLYID